MSGAAIAKFSSSAVNQSMPGLKVKELTSFADKLTGLIGSQKAYPVYFRTRWGIHTFGLKFAIDVLILDSRFQVVKAVAGLRPNRIYFWPVKYQNVVELPAGDIRRLNIKPGDKLNLIRSTLPFYKLF